MSYTFRPAVRAETSLLLGIAGPSGSGKTASALKVARGILGGQDEGIFVIDTEADRALHYACAPGEEPGPFRFRFQHCSMRPPFSSANYSEVIGVAVNAGARVIVVDSMSHEHEGKGGMLEAHAKELERMGGRDSQTFAAWIKPKAAHNDLVNVILQQRCHFIFCFRAKDKMKLVKVMKDGRERTEPVQLGWTAICSDRFEYEMTTLLMLPPAARGVPDLSLESTKVNAHHVDFFPKGHPIGEDAGRRLAEWARGGAPALTNGAPTTHPQRSATPAEAPRSAPAAGDERAGLVEAIKVELDAIVASEGKPRDAVLQDIFGTRQWARVERGLEEGALRQGLVRLMARRPKAVAPDSATSSEDPEESEAFRRMMDDSTPDERAELLGEIEPLRAALGYTGAVWKDVCKEQIGLSLEWADEQQLATLRDYLRQIAPTTA